MKINYIVIHCADTPNDREVTLADIDRWHREKGWDGCGYHYVIRRSGLVELGRPLDTPGAHVYGYNNESIGICLVGRDEFTDAQWRSLEGVVRAEKSKHPYSDVVGHCDLDQSGKTCPNFPPMLWWSKVRNHE